MAITNGVILYSIENDGCLNGVYTNVEANGEMYNEIAKKIVNGSNDLEGTYKCLYLDQGENVDCNLTISKSGNGNIYSFNWERNGDNIHEGIGYIVNPRQIVVNYWDVI